MLRVVLAIGHHSALRIILKSLLVSSTHSIPFARYFLLKDAAAGRDIDLIVVTDAEAILGIGDWGTNGVEISVGKLMVYTAAAGVDPNRIMPVVIDAGTNRQELLDNPLYLGERHKRVDEDRYNAFIDNFVTTVEQLFPNLYLHFEDFGRSHALADLTPTWVLFAQVALVAVCAVAGFFASRALFKKHFEKAGVV